MKILLLVNSDVSTYYSASLMQRGHRVIAHDSGAFENPPIKEYMDCDGCLLFSDDPQMIKSRTILRRSASRFGVASGTCRAPRWVTTDSCMYWSRCFWSSSERWSLDKYLFEKQRNP
jgi:hypothetical protein